LIDCSLISVLDEILDMAKNITLIGMAGAGKSVIGKALAASLDYEFIDIDEVIERKTGSGLQQLLDDSGEDTFLDIEEAAVLELGEIDECVISPGGSVVYSAAAMKFLKEKSIVVFLNAPFESIEKRLSDKAVRGIVGFKQKSLRSLYGERLNLYRIYKDMEIEITEECDIDSVVERIIQRL
jgi:shikimate kinase